MEFIQFRNTELQKYSSHYSPSDVPLATYISQTIFKIIHIQEMELQLSLRPASATFFRFSLDKYNMHKKSGGTLRALTSSWRPLGPLDFVIPC